MLVSTSYRIVKSTQSVQINMRLNGMLKHIQIGKRWSFVHITSGPRVIGNHCIIYTK